MRRDRCSLCERLRLALHIYLQRQVVASAGQRYFLAGLVKRYRLARRRFQPQCDTAGLAAAIQCQQIRQLKTLIAAEGNLYRFTQAKIAVLQCQSERLGRRTTIGIKVLIDDRTKIQLDIFIPRFKRARFRHQRTVKIHVFGRQTAAAHACQQ